MKNILKLVGLFSIGYLVFFILTNIQSILLHSLWHAKKDISWGIAVYYGNLIYLAILVSTVFSWYLKRTFIILPIIIIAFAAYCYYWTPVLFIYPYRTAYILVTGAIVYIIIHTTIYKKRKIIFS